jgi:hypothetical protein
MLRFLVVKLNVAVGRLEGLPVSQVSLSHTLNMFQKVQGLGRLHTGMLSDIMSLKPRCIKLSIVVTGCCIPFTFLHVQSVLL